MSVLSFLGKEILWGRLAWIALITTLLAGFAFAGSLSSGNRWLYFLALAVVAGGGVVVGNAAPRHPFWNALVYGLFSLLFATGLLFLYALGSSPTPTGEELGKILLGGLIYFLPLIPQALAGAWIATSFRRLREMGQQVGKEAGRAAKKGRPTERKKR